jgi:N-acylneuraminate cytidylyltransferase
MYGAKIPFIRGSELSDDHTGTVPVIMDAILKIELIDKVKVNDVFCIYPCVPLLQPENLIQVYEDHKKNKALNRYTFPVAEYTSAPQRAFKLGVNGEVIRLYPEYERVRTQDLDRIYYDAGQFYCGSRNLWISGNNIHEFGIGYVIPARQVVDIDTEDDWIRAEIYSKINMAIINKCN